MKVRDDYLADYAEGEPAVVERDYWNEPLFEGVEPIPVRLELQVRRWWPGEDSRHPGQPELRYEIEHMFSQLQPCVPFSGNPATPLLWDDGGVELLLRNEQVPELDQSNLRLDGLVASLWRKGRLEILACSCGDPMCGGFSDTFVWRRHGQVGWVLCSGWGGCVEQATRHSLVFDEAQYREEVLAKARLALELHEGLGRGSYFVNETESPWGVRAMLREVERFTVDYDRPTVMSWD